MSNPAQHGPAGELPPGLSGSGLNAYDKHAVLLGYARGWDCRALVETGLYYGQGSGMPVFLGGHVDRYVAIDWQDENIASARSRVPMGEYYCGDSAAVLQEILTDDWPELPTLFWLDAHALTEDEGSPSVCPVLGELDAIGAWAHAASTVVLIDDLWGMGSIRGWPTLPELRERAASFGVWDLDEAVGIMRLTPKL